VRSFPHPAAVFAVAFSPDGTRILTGADDGTAILWQTDTGAVVQNFQGHQGAVNGVAFATGGKPLTGGGDGKVILWDAATARPAFTFRNEGGAVHALACSRDGKRLAAGYRDGSAVVWELASRKQLHVLRRHRRQVNAVAFGGPAGEWLVTASSDRKAIVWDVAKGEPLGRPLGEGLVEGHDGSIRAVAFRPDGKRLLTGGADRRAVLWELGDRPFPIRAFQSSVGPVSVLAVGPASGGSVLAGSADRGATWWSVAEGTAAGVEGHEGAVTGAAFSRDGKQAVTGSLDGRVHLWDVARRSSKPLQMPEVRFEVLAVALRGDGGAVLAGGRDGRILLWETGADTPPRVLGRHDGAVNAVAFSEDGKRAFSASNDRTAIAWDIADGKCLTRFEEHRWEVRTLALSRDGRRLVTGDADGQVVLWDAVAGNKVRTLSRQPARVNAVALSGDGRWILVGSAQTASLWDAESGERVRTFEGHAGEVRAVAFSPDDRRVLTGSEDGTVRLWDAAVGDDQSRGEEVARLLSLHGGRDWLVLTPEGLFDGSEGGRNKVQFRLAGAVAPVDRYFKALYRPCLLQDLWQGERPLPEVDLAAKRPPTVRFLSPSSGETVSDSQITVEVEAHDGGDGIKDVWLYKLVGSEPFPILATGPAHRKDGVVRRSFVVALTQGENRLKARTTTRDESCDGAPAFLSLTYEKPVPTPPAPKLYLLAVGISNYADQRLNKGVQFAAQDAEAMTDVFWKRGPGRLYHPDSRKWLLLNHKATRAGIEAALEEIKAKAQSEDVLVVFLAGHGELGHGEVAAKRYFFIPHEFQPGSAEAVERQGLSWEKLEEYLTQTGVRKQVVVLDTCHSGAALERKSKKGGASPEEKALKSAIVALHRQNGAYAVAAARADEKAFEFETLKHGRLTYTLLAGLGAVADGPLAQRGNEALRDKDGMIDVLEWVLFASKQVPALCRVDNVHPQTPVFKVTGSTPFPLLPATDPSER
jgi:WD40 repeat protein